MCEVILPMVGVADIWGDFPVLSGYATKARQHADMGAIWDETAAALAAPRG